MWWLIPIAIAGGAAVIKWLIDEDEKPRVVVLVGPRDSGKTALWQRT